MRHQSIRASIAFLALALIVACNATPRQQYTTALRSYNAATEQMILAMETGLWAPSPEDAAILLDIDDSMTLTLGELKILLEANDPTFDSKLAEFLMLVRRARMIAQKIDGTDNPTPLPRSDTE